MKHMFQWMEVRCVISACESHKHKKDLEIEHAKFIHNNKGYDGVPKAEQ